MTGFVEIFSELGLGSAIVQRKQITQRECSSNFWFSLAAGFGFAAIAFGLAYPTAQLFDEARAIPVTQLIAVQFLIGALMVVPFNLLMREMKFKLIGMIQLVSVAISSVSMLWMAYEGFGVWTLLGGTLILRFMTVVLAFMASKWRPDFHFSWSEVRPFLRFGLNVAGARALFYIFQKMDVLIVGKVLGTQTLGYYSMAMHLASLPTDKVIGLVSQFLFPVFSQLQSDLQEVQKLYLRVAKYMALFVCPLFFAGAFWGNEIIHVVLGEKWQPLSFLFRGLCLFQLVLCLTAINGVVHPAMGRAHLVAYFYLAGIIVMAGPLYLAAQYGLDALAVPWVAIYPALCIGYTAITLRAVRIDVSIYIKTVLGKIVVALCIVICVKLVISVAIAAFSDIVDHMIVLIIEIAMGSTLYLIYLFLYERTLIDEVRSIVKA